MTKHMTVNVRISGPLTDFIAMRTGEDGLYENASEYVRDLIRRDKEREDRERFEALKAELQRVFAKPDSEFIEIDRDEWLAQALTRNRG